MIANAPRVVLVTRKTELDSLRARHATRGQAAFFLKQRGKSIEPLDEAHQRLQNAVAQVTRAIPEGWRKNRVDRDDLDRFLFEPDDVVVALGQDGLVANLAKYLSGQPVIGLNPMPDWYDGILVPHAPESAADLFELTATGQLSINERTMVEARLDDGQRLLALNEIFVGHRSHQSARYRLRFDGMQERQSSSGLIVATGTGATGWARSIREACKSKLAMPGVDERALGFFVREAFPSVSTGTSLVDGRIEAPASLQITSEMNTDGVIFGDGIEADRIEFGWGQRLDVRVADTCLNLVGG
jgi:NAD kinase